MLGLVVAAIAGTPEHAYAQGAPDLPDEPEKETVEIVDPSAESDEPEDPLVAEMAELRDRIDVLEAQVEQMNEMEVDPSSFFEIRGHVDIGAFWAFGNGAGFVQDFGNQQFPQYRGQYAWVFLGDILASTINSRGEAADLGETPGIQRFDSIDSNGAPGFLVNELNLTFNVGLGSSARMTAMVNFLPRTGSHFDLGDIIEVSLAQLEWVVSESIPTSVFVGKVEPVIGIEYKDRIARDRFGITPSLIARYTIGTPIGLKVRSRLLDEWILVAASVTNGSAGQEQFHFYDEIDSNFGKTLSGRLAVNVPLNEFAMNVFSAPLEVGFSGQWGPQDRARDSRDNMTLFGPDIEYRGLNFRIKGQLLFGDSPGRPEDGAFGLDLKFGGYLEFDYLIASGFGALVRVGFRDALVELGEERLYLTKSWRLTIGGNYAISEHLALKAEFLKNFEYGDIEQISNDVLTSSLLVIF